MLAGLAYWGSRTGDGVVVNVLLAIAAPALAATVWGMFAAPRSPRRLPTAPRLVVELIVFGAAAAALADADHAALGIALGLAAVVVEAAVLVLGEPESPATPAAHS